MEVKCVKCKMIKSDSNLHFLDEVEGVVNYSIMVLPTKCSIGNFVCIYYIFLLSV